VVEDRYAHDLCDGIDGCDVQIVHDGFVEYHVRGIPQ
jgi:hypothetical protein